MAGGDLFDPMQVADLALGAQGGVDGLAGRRALAIRGVRLLGIGDGEQRPGQGEVFLAPAAGEKAVVADAVEAGLGDVGKPAVDEFFCIESHDALDIGVFDAVVLVPEEDLAVVDAQQASVGDGDAVDVAPEVADQVAGLGEGGLGVDDPVVTVEALAQRLPAFLVGQLRLATEVELAGGAQLLECFEVLAAEHL